MNTNPVQFLRSRRGQQPTTLTSCPLCLRVLRGSDWVEAERVIRDIRSYELAAPPRLEWTVCELCSESIFNRRAQPDEPIAA
jgi:hypothetical protein